MDSITAYIASLLMAVAVLKLHYPQLPWPISLKILSQEGMVLDGPPSLHLTIGVQSIILRLYHVATDGELFPHVDIHHPGELPCQRRRPPPGQRSVAAAAEQLASGFRQASLVAFQQQQQQKQQLQQQQQDRGDNTPLSPLSALLQGAGFAPLQQNPAGANPPERPGPALRKNWQPQPPPPPPPQQPLPQQQLQAQPNLAIQDLLNSGAAALQEMLQQSRHLFPDQTTQQLPVALAGPAQRQQQQQKQRQQIHMERCVNQ